MIPGEFIFAGAGVLLIAFLLVWFALSVINDDEQYDKELPDIPGTFRHYPTANALRAAQEAEQRYRYRSYNERIGTVKVNVVREVAPIKEVVITLTGTEAHELRQELMYLNNRYGIAYHVSTELHAQLNNK